MEQHGPPSALLSPRRTLLHGVPSTAPRRLGMNLQLVPGRTKSRNGSWDGPCEGPVLRDQGSLLWPGDSAVRLAWPQVGLPRPRHKGITLGHWPSVCGNPKLAWVSRTPRPGQAAAPLHRDPWLWIRASHSKSPLCWVSIQHVVLAAPLSYGPQFPILSLFSPSPWEDTSLAWVWILHSDHTLTSPPCWRLRC